MSNNKPKALIAGILPSSFVDGPGNRFVVFMQGCNLRCIYCQNPETWDPTGKSNPLCMSLDLDKLLELFNRCADFVSGITFSGGEPLLQWRFIKEFSKALKEYYPDKNILIDTNIDVNSTIIANIIKYVDYFTPDIKAPNSELYNKITGGVGDFNNVLSNLELLSNTDKIYEIRLPIIPTITDKDQQFLEWIDLLKQFFNKDIRIRIIKFRSHGVKNEFLKNKTVSEQAITRFIDILRSKGFKNIIYLS